MNFKFFFISVVVYLGISSHLLQSMTTHFGWYRKQDQSRVLEETPDYVVIEQPITSVPELQGSCMRLLLINSQISPEAVAIAQVRAKKDFLKRWPHCLDGEPVKRWYRKGVDREKLLKDRRKTSGTYPAHKCIMNHTYADAVDQYRSFALVDKLQGEKNSHTLAATIAAYVQYPLDQKNSDRDGGVDKDGEKNLATVAFNVECRSIFHRSLQYAMGKKTTVIIPEKTVAKIDAVYEAFEKKYKSREIFDRCAQNAEDLN